MKKTLYAMLFFLFFGKIAFAQSPYIGEIRIFAGNFAPSGWQFCDGSLIPISENDTLFSLIGTTYGGDGQATFAVPDLRGRVPVGIGQGPVTRNVAIGENFGAENVALTSNQLPSHAHSAQVSVNNTNANLSVPTTNSSIGKMGTLSGRQFIPANSYNTSDPDVSLGNMTTLTTGSSTPVSLMKPYCGVNYIISLYGIYPTQN
jgi:microcystin-dependent protein